MALCPGHGAICRSQRRWFVVFSVLLIILFLLFFLFIILFLLVFIFLLNSRSPVAILSVLGAVVVAHSIVVTLMS